jgi:hypothetical protein
MAGERHRRREELTMKKRSFTVRVGPLAMSLAAAALTAIAFAAISLADSDGGSGSGSRSDGRDEHIFRAGPPGGGPGVMFKDELSEADRQKMEDFSECMEDNGAPAPLGAPAPPDPGEIDPSDGLPKPPSAEDRQKLRDAWEACKSNLPEELQKAGPPELHIGGCGPHPGSPGTEERGKNENQSNDSRSSSSGATT